MKVCSMLVFRSTGCFLMALRATDMLGSPNPAIPRPEYALMVACLLGKGIN